MVTPPYTFLGVDTKYPLAAKSHWPPWSLLLLRVSDVSFTRDSTPFAMLPRSCLALGLAMAAASMDLAYAFVAPLRTHLSRQHQHHQQQSLRMIHGEDTQAAADASEVGDSSSESCAFYGLITAFKWD